MWEKAALIDAVVMLIKWRRELQRIWDATLNYCGDAALNCCRDATLNCCRDAAFNCHRDATLNCYWDATLKTRRSHLKLPDADAGTALDACLTRIELEICATYFDHWRADRRPGSFNSQFTLIVHHLRSDPRKKLLSFFFLKIRQMTAIAFDCWGDD